LPGPVKKLLVRIALEKAISFEEQAYRFYESALKKSIMRHSFHLLKRLLSEELKHRMRLEVIQKSGVFDTPDIEATGSGTLGSEVSGSRASNEPEVDVSVGRSLEEESPGGKSAGSEEEKGIFVPDMQEEVDEFCAQWPEISPEATSKDILYIALKKEQCGYQLYSRLKDRFILKGLHDVYAGLAKEEYRHIRWIEGELERYGDEA